AFGLGGLGLVVHGGLLRVHRALSRVCRRAPNGRLSRIGADARYGAVRVVPACRSPSIRVHAAGTAGTRCRDCSNASTTWLTPVPAAGVPWLKVLDATTRCVRSSSSLADSSMFAEGRGWPSYADSKRRRSSTRR